MSSTVAEMKYLKDLLPWWLYTGHHGEQLFLDLPDSSL